MLQGQMQAVTNLNKSVANLPSLTPYLKKLNDATTAYDRLPKNKSSMLVPLINSITHLNTTAFAVSPHNCLV